MSDAFRDRERALENAFFHKIDKELLVKLKESISGGSKRDQLTTVSGITDAAVLDRLPSTTKDELKPEPRLAAPMPMNSWSASTL